MIKAAFITQKPILEKASACFDLGLNAVFLGSQNLEEKTLKELKKNFKVFVEVGIFAGEEWWKDYPDGRPINAKGKLIEKENGYVGVCPGHPGVRAEKLAIIEKILEFDIDGIWLDFIRYPCHWEVKKPNLDQACFCAHCLLGFEKFAQTQVPKGSIQKKADWILKNQKKSWTLFKCNQIKSFVQQTRVLIDKSEKEVKLGIFAVPWKKSDFNGAITKILGQDFAALAELVHVFSPMTYHRMVGKEVSWIGETVDYFSRKTEKEVLPIIQVRDLPESLEDKLSAKELNQAISQASALPSSGFILFTLNHFLGTSKKDFLLGI